MAETRRGLEVPLEVCEESLARERVVGRAINEAMKLLMSASILNFEWVDCWERNVVKFVCEGGG